jgi:hypothetical protein
MLGSCSVGPDKSEIFRFAGMFFFSHILALHRPKNGATTTIPKATPNRMCIRSPFLTYVTYRRSKRVSIVKFFSVPEVTLEYSVRSSNPKTEHHRSGITDSDGCACQLLIEIRIMKSVGHAAMTGSRTTLWIETRTKIDCPRGNKAIDFLPIRRHESARPGWECLAKCERKSAMP